MNVSLSIRINYVLKSQEDKGGSIVIPTTASSIVLRSIAYLFVSCNWSLFHQNIDPFNSKLLVDALLYGLFKCL